MLPPRLLRTTWSRRNRNHFVFPPILSRLTQEEALADPALLVILADESVLGHIMAIPTTPIRLTGNGPLPHTSSARNWFIGVVARAHSGTRAADINPEISARPPLPPNIIVFHQLKEEEVDRLLWQLAKPATWGGDLQRHCLLGQKSPL